MPTASRAFASGRTVLDEIQIDPNSDISLRRQLVNQFIVQIAAGRLKGGQSLPSVRQLERLKKIHRHTISRAYSELVKQGWLIRKRGSLLKVNSFEKPPNSAHDLNSVVDLSIRLAQEHGYTAEQLQQCLRARLEGNRPDHLLIVSTDAGLSTILKTELQENVSCRIRQCLPEELTEQSRRLPGALIVWIAGAAPVFSPLVPEGTPCYSVTICYPTENIERIRQLRKPSVIAVVSVSKLFLERAAGVISPLLGRSHSLSKYFMPTSGRLALDGADLVFCDSVAMTRIKGPEIHRYRVVSPESIEHIKRAIGRSQASERKRRSHGVQ
jgi:DNA-binding transcriptional regulator YhcF (GntR family)